MVVAVAVAVAVAVTVALRLAFQEMKIGQSGHGAFLRGAYFYYKLSFI